MISALLRNERVRNHSLLKETHRSRSSDVTSAHVSPAGVAFAPGHLGGKRRDHVIDSIGHDDVVVDTNDERYGHHGTAHT